MECALYCFQSMISMSLETFDYVPGSATIFYIKLFQFITHTKKKTLLCIFLEKSNYKCMRQIIFQKMSFHEQNEKTFLEKYKIQPCYQMVIGCDIVFSKLCIKEFKASLKSIANY